MDELYQKLVIVEIQFSIHSRNITIAGIDSGRPKAPMEIYHLDLLFHICSAGLYVVPPAPAALWQFEPKALVMTAGCEVPAAPLVWNHQGPGFWAVSGVAEYLEPPPGKRPAPNADVVKVLWVKLPGVVVDAPVETMVVDTDCPK
jgi:hypothetical protein